MLRLKLLVGTMTFLIFVCFCLMIYGVMKQADKLQAPLSATLTLPAVSQVDSIAAYPEGISLYVRSTEGDYIYLFNTALGREAGRIKIDRAGEKPVPMGPSTP